MRVAYPPTDPPEGCEYHEDEDGYPEPKPCRSCLDEWEAGQPDTWKEAEGIA